MSLGLSRSLSKLTISPDAPQFATYRYRRYALAMNPLTYIIPDKLKSAFFSHTLGTNVSGSADFSGGRKGMSEHSVIFAK